MRETAQTTYAGRGLGNIGAKAPSGRHNRMNNQFCLRCGRGVSERSGDSTRMCRDCRSTDPWFVEQVSR